MGHEEKMRPEQAHEDAERGWGTDRARGWSTFLPGGQRYCICHRCLERCPAQESSQLLSRTVVSRDGVLGILEIPSLHEKPHFQHT